MIEFSGATFDSRLVKPGMLFVALKGEKSDGHAFIPQALAAGAAGIVDGLEDLQRLARDYRRALKAKVIGVTGSAGKTTTKEFQRAFLAQVGKTHATEGNFNNHIGLPLTILNCPKDADFLVVEMGTNHPGEIAALCAVAEPDAGLITNVGTAHLEFFKTQDGIAREKGTLAASARDFFVIGEDNARLGALEAMCRGEAVVAPVSRPWLKDALATVLPGAHNVANASLAFAVAERYGATPATCLAALRAFALPGARWRRVEKGGALYIDDTYNANPDSMIAALKALEAMPAEGRRMAILGDMFELGPSSLDLHRRVFAAARELGIARIIGVGATCAQCGPDFAFATADELRGQLAGLVAKGDLVLLKASHAMKLGSLLKD